MPDLIHALLSLAAGGLLIPLVLIALFPGLDRYL